MFDQVARRKMLRAAEAAVRGAVTGKSVPVQLDADEFGDRRGVFVTLKKGGELRGCIGRLSSDEPLAKTIPRVAVDSALSDPRFPAVGEDELDHLQYEISIMTPMEPIEASEIEVGRHGVHLEVGSQRAVFLPQVATEWGWDREELLRHLCRKAGLSDDAWATAGARIMAFEAEVFCE